MIGHKLWQILSAHNKDVLGPSTGSGSLAVMLFAMLAMRRFEAADFDGVTETLDRLHPDVIINCIGSPSASWNETFSRKCSWSTRVFPSFALWASDIRYSL